jgi:hypothetical protein
MATDGSMTASSMASPDENPRPNARLMETVVKDRVDSRTSMIVSRRDDEGMITCASIKREIAMREIMIAASLRLDPYFASIRVSSRVAVCDKKLKNSRLPCTASFAARHLLPTLLLTVLSHVSGRKSRCPIIWPALCTRSCCLVSLFMLSTRLC